MAYKTEVPLDEEICISLLIESASAEWEPSARIIGKAMFVGLNEHGASVGDLALEERLRHLASTGRIEIDDATLPYGKYKVRRPT